MQPHQAPSTSLSVLVVDDEPLIRWSLRKGLSKRGHTVVEAKTAGETLAVISANPDRFAIVILDYRLPDRHDLTLLQEVRRMAPGSAVWMMTAYADAEMRAQALVLGARAIIDKPFQIDDVVSLVESAASAGM